MGNTPLLETHQATLQFAAIDTGGTFTDCIRIVNGQAQISKILSTPAQPANAVLQGLQQLESNQPAIDLLIHGTTVATNALLERKLARVSLVITAGFRDLVAIGRQAREHLYQLQATRPEPLYQQVIEVQERISADGEALLPLTSAEIERIVAAIDPASEAVAICCLFAYAYPQHEQALAQALRQQGQQVSASHEVLPVYREFERFSTTLANAALQPIMQSYMAQLQSGLGQRFCRLMQSNGGSLSLAEVQTQPVRCALSGPAGGLVGAHALGQLMQRPRLLTFDMGGTSTDVSLIDAQLPLQSETIINGIPLALPMLDIQTVGAGGGSLVTVDPGGLLRVGPASAGADPGPVAYGRGQQLTVSDAHVLLGRLPAQTRLGGSLKLHLEPVKTAFEWLAAQLEISSEAAALGVIAVANAHMERALRKVSVERGQNPSDFALFCFGGAGGLHACDLALSLQIPQIILPVHAGVFSAFGMLYADQVRDLSLTVLGQIELHQTEQLNAAFAQMQQQLPDEALATYAYGLDLRYAGQSFEINLPWQGDPQASATAFHQAHARLHSYARPEHPLELVTLRLRQTLAVKGPDLPLWQNRQAAVPEQTLLWLRDGWIQAPAYQRSELAQNQLISGPALILESSSTFWLAPGFALHLDPWGNLLIVQKSLL